MKKSANFKQLELCLNFADQIDVEDKLLYLNATKKFIEDYNAQQKGLSLAACHEGLTKSLILTIQNTKWITPKKQAFYVIVSTIGIAYFVSGGSIGFAWFAMNGTNLQLQLTSDLAGEHLSVHRYFSSWPYFYRSDSLKVIHMEQFQVFMFETLREIEKKLASTNMPQADN